MICKYLSDRLKIVKCDTSCSEWGSGLDGITATYTIHTTLPQYTYSYIRTCKTN